MGRPHDRQSSGKLRTGCPLHNVPEEACTTAYLLLGWSAGAGAVSTGFCVSVGWPLTSPGRDDIPGSFVVPLEGLGGRATLPEVPWSALLPEAPGLLRVSVAEPELVDPVVAEPALLEPVSVPEVVELLGVAGVVGLVLVSSAAGVSDGEVRVLCIGLASLLRPCAADVSDFLWWCFFAFFSFEGDTDSSELPFAPAPLFTSPELSLPMPVVVDAAPLLGTALEEVSLLEELSGCSFALFEPVSPAGDELAAGLLLGSELLLDEALDGLPGKALLFWSAGNFVVPLSSVLWLLGVEVVRVSLVPVPVLVCARAENADKAIASAAIPMIFIEPPLAVKETVETGTRRSYGRGNAGPKRKEGGGRSPSPSPDVLPAGGWITH